LFSDCSASHEYCWLHDAPKGCYDSFKVPSIDLIGGDLDGYGCKRSAGERWCEAKRQCVRAWSETCEPQADMSQRRCNLSSVITVSQSNFEGGIAMPASLQWCQDLCRITPNCTWVSYRRDNNWCYLFSDCSASHEYCWLHDAPTGCYDSFQLDNTTNAIEAVAEVGSKYITPDVDSLVSPDARNTIGRDVSGWLFYFGIGVLVSAVACTFYCIIVVKRTQSREVKTETVSDLDRSLEMASKSLLNV